VWWAGVNLLPPSRTKNLATGYVHGGAKSGQGSILTLLLYVVWRKFLNSLYYINFPYLMELPKFTALP
jgi:hypothetical protein